MKKNYILPQFIKNIFILKQILIFVFKYLQNIKKPDIIIWFYMSYELWVN